MKTSQYFLRKIKALTADKQENLQAPLFEELSDSETIKIVGGIGLSEAIETLERRFLGEVPLVVPLDLIPLDLE